MHEMVKKYRLNFKNMLFDTSDQEFGSRWILTILAPISQSGKTPSNNLSAKRVNQKKIYMESTC